MIWFDRLIRRIENVFRKRPACLFCGIPFSDWFTWDGWSYCWPCWEKTGWVRFEPESHRSDFDSLNEVQHGPCRGLDPTPEG